MLPPDQEILSCCTPHLPVDRHQTVQRIAIWYVYAVLQLQTPLHQIPYHQLLRLRVASFKAKKLCTAEYTTFIAPSHLSRGDQAVTAHTSSVPAPPYPIRAEGPDLWYQMRLEDTMVGLSLAPKSRGARIRECVYVGLVGGGVGGWGWGGWLCGPVVHVPLGGSTEGARPSWRPTRHQDGSDSVTILPVAERVVRAIVAAPMASPAPVTIGSRCPAQPVDYRTGQSVV